MLWDQYELVQVSLSSHSTTVERFTLSHTSKWTPHGVDWESILSLSGVTAIKSHSSWTPHGVYVEYVELSFWFIWSSSGVPDTPKWSPKSMCTPCELHVNSMDSMWSPCGVHQNYLESMWSPPEISGVHVESTRNLQSPRGWPSCDLKKMIPMRFELETFRIWISDPADRFNTKPFDHR